jgi:hypothetical protein
MLVMQARAYRFLAVVLWRGIRWYLRRRSRPLRWAMLSRGLFIRIVMFALAVRARRRVG